jgi:hypothetical protein
VPLISWLALIALAAYLQHVLRASAVGARSLPAYPAIDDVVVDLIYPLGRFVVVIAVLCGPSMLYRRWTDAPSDDPFLWALRSIPILLGPFAVTVASIARSSRVLFDIPLLARVFVRTAGDYAMAWLFLLLLVLVHGLIGTIAARSDIALVALSAFRYYALFVAFHVLGRYVMQTRHLVDWEA